MSFNQQQIKLENRITKLEVSLQEVKADLLEIRDNHLKHLARRIDSGSKVVIGILVGLIMNLIGVVLTLLK